MDVLTHGLIPYAVFTVLRRPARQRVAAAIAGFAPDVDIFWAWTAPLFPEAYVLQHRGFSHTLIGAPLLGLLALYLLSRPALKRRLPRLENVHLDRSILFALIAGAWSHLLLDGLTITGVPALWPLLTDRYTVNLYFFSVSYMMLGTLLLWIPIWRKKADDAYVGRALVIMVVILASAALLRGLSYPRDLEGDAEVTPGPYDWTWIVSDRNDTGVAVWRVTLGERDEATFYPEHNTTAAASAIDACQNHPAYVGWQWKRWGLAVVNATREGEGWTVEFQDSARLYESDRSRRLGLNRIFGDERERGLRCEVDASGRVDFEPPRSFWG